jgi:hypothetical protein
MMGKRIPYGAVDDPLLRRAVLVEKERKNGYGNKSAYRRKGFLFFNMGGIDGKLQRITGLMGYRGYRGNRPGFYAH